MLQRRILLRELTMNALGVLLVLLSIVLTIQFVRLFGQAAVGKLALDAVLTTIAFQLLQALPVFLSITLFISVLMSFMRAWRDHEMHVWFAAGVSPLSWFRPVLWFLVPMIVVITALSFWMTPWAMRLSEKFEAQLQLRDDLGLATPGVFKVARGGDVVYFIENLVGLGNKASRVFVDSQQEGSRGVMVSAYASQTTEKNGDKFLSLDKGQRYEEINGLEYRLISFDRYSVRIKAKEALDPPAAMRAIPTKQLYQSNNISDKAELHWRIGVPISALVLALLAIPLASFNPRSGRGWNLVIALLVYLVYVNSLTIGQALMVKGKLSVALGLWPIHGVAILILIWLMAKMYGGLPAFISHLTQKEESV
ncbi:LPS export ABC transporter permease LptF [Leeia sp. TBRC 13508]|uniref:Lipopolysaccharide export system permease protein LptF n=1 Tax=Leeia speluncae TaxID=2884804 RepID=A0ABS8D744_9NEIS|nr:LPS export ABC transporter permease LptF [Leeia speluncae]MCB6184019.1 LPS export ABC transporter permease LptF [Leeia speluncae]